MPRVTIATADRPALLPPADAAVSYVEQRADPRRGGATVLSAIVLAAGESKRMEGRVKALLPIGGTSFLERIVSRLDAVETGEILVVLGFRHDEIAERVNLGSARVLRNERWEEGQLSSLRVGVRNLSPLSEGVIFTLVDHPLVEVSTYERLIAEWKSRREGIVVPAYRGRKGHPVVLPRRLYDSLLGDELPHGARDLLARESGSVRLVPVDDTGVVQDIDTPDDYRRMIGTLQ